MSDFEKEELMDVSIQDMEPNDWRGILAMASYLIVLASLLFRPEYIDKVTILAILASKWYFDGRDEDERDNRSV